VVAPGIVEPWGGEVALSAREPGWIAEIRVAEGEVVVAGQVLARLDDEPQRAALALARAEAAEAEAALARTRRGATAEERRQVAAEADADAARAELARRQAERAERLGAQGAMAPAEVERARGDADAQAAQARASAARRRALERGARSEDRLAAEQRLAAARARVERAEADLARRQVVAPAAGTVLLSRYHVGERYDGSAGPLFVLGDLSRLQVRVEVDEIDAPGVTPGAACALVGDDGASLGGGTVVRLAPRFGRRGLGSEAPTARADVRVREVFVEVAAPAGGLAPGQRVWAHVQVGATTAAGTAAGQPSPAPSSSP
jgi:HlyD family secretion protein